MNTLARDEPSKSAKGRFVNQLRTWLAQSDLPEDGRLPPERKLTELFGVNRNEVRKALAVLELEGRVWRHVGKGTFVVREEDEIKGFIRKVADATSPPEAMQVRLLIEPEIARLAAWNATTVQIAKLRKLCAQMRAAESWQVYEELDWVFHNLIAEASGNYLLGEVQKLVNGVRRSVIWGHLQRRQAGPPGDYHSFNEHDAIIEAVANRDREAASQAMRRHLEGTASALTNDGR